ncbi:VPS26B isoform 6, partial [Pan troglodytes]
GEITQSQAFDFEFTHVEKPYESYTGQNVKLRGFVLSVCTAERKVLKPV